MNPAQDITPDFGSTPVVLAVAILGLVLIGVIASVIHELFTDISHGTIAESESHDSETAS